jgi:hypothetical protein
MGITKAYNMFTPYGLSQISKTTHHIGHSRENGNPETQQRENVGNTGFLLQQE